MNELPPELRGYRDDLVRAARRHAARRTRRRKQARLSVVLAATFLLLAGLAAATGVVSLPFGAAPRAVTYDATYTGPDGRLQQLRCTDRDGDMDCLTGDDVLPLDGLANELQRRGATSGRLSLVRLCRRPGGCRTLPASEAARQPQRDELVWLTVAGVRPPSRGHARFDPAAVARGAQGQGATVRVVGGPHSGRSVDCARTPDAPLCALQREATARGVLDVDRFLRTADATARIVEAGRRCVLTGQPSCTELEPAVAQRLAEDPSTIEEPGVAVIFVRQAAARGFGGPVQLPTRPAHRAAGG